MAAHAKPIVLITGAAGNIGTSLAAALQDDYRIVGMDREGRTAAFPLVAVDLGSDQSVTAAFKAFRRRFGGAIASVIHLAAYFDFTGEDNPLYGSVNVEGTRLACAAWPDSIAGEPSCAGSPNGGSRSDVLVQ
jgi:nucleoside-diphosphate-sugar epimerase